MNSDIFAAIDIGSNAVRLLVGHALFEKDAYEMKQIAYLRVPIRLGEDVFITGRVGEDKFAKLLDAFHAFQHLVRAFGASQIRACATSAMRDAENGEQLVEQIMKSAGISIEIISGQEEADLVYAASSAKEIPPEDGSSLYVDVGGGSTEVILYEENRMIIHESFQIGTVRMLYPEASQEAMDKEKKRLASCLGDAHRLYSPKALVASGGNINKIHKILGKKKREIIVPAELQKLHAKLNPLNTVERMLALDLNYYRADVIVPALEIFMNICGHCPSVRAIYVPKAGLADGLIHDMCKKRLLAEKSK